MRRLPFFSFVQHFDDVDTITVCACGAQPRNNCVLDVVLGREPNLNELLLCITANLAANVQPGGD